MSYVYGIKRRPPKIRLNSKTSIALGQAGKGLTDVVKCALTLSGLVPV